MDEATGVEMDAYLQRRSATERHERGVAQFAAMLNHWLGRSPGMTHDLLAAIADWGMGEKSEINKTIISRLKTCKTVRGAAFPRIEGFAAANRAIWLWQVKGPEAARKALGPPSSWGVKEKVLDDALWLPSPLQEGQPLRFGEMVELHVGYLDLPYLTTTDLSPKAAKDLSDRLVDLVDDATVQRGWGASRGIAEIEAAYPVQDKGRRRRLKAVVTRDKRFTLEELETEMEDLAATLETLRQLPAGSYSAHQLRAELLPDRLQAS